MSVSVDDLFNGMYSAEQSTAGVFFGPGLYRVKLKEIEHRPKGFKGNSVHFRFQIVESGNPEHPVGAVRTWIMKLDKMENLQRVFSDIKSLIFALLGTSSEEVGPVERNPEAHKQAAAFFVAATNEKYAKENGVDPKALYELECRLEATPITTRNGQPYLRMMWSPLDEAGNESED